MTIMVEHHFARTLKGRANFIFFQPLKVHMKLFQNRVSPGYIEGLSYNLHIRIFKHAHP